MAAPGLEAHSRHLKMFTNRNDYTQDSQVVSKATTSCLSVSMTSFLALSHTEGYLKNKG